MELSADFNANIVEPGVVQEYLETWRCMMTLMTRFILDMTETFH